MCPTFLTLGADFGVFGPCPADCPFGLTLASVPVAAARPLEGGGLVSFSSFSFIVSWTFSFLSLRLFCSFLFGERLRLKLFVSVPHESAGLLDKRLLELFLLNFLVSFPFLEPPEGVAPEEVTDAEEKDSKLTKVS